LEDLQGRPEGKGKLGFFLGHNCDLNGWIPFKGEGSTASTEDGKKQVVSGQIKVPMQHQLQKKGIELYIIPSLKQDLYLRIDF